jgi:hypothetical protein
MENPIRKLIFFSQSDRSIFVKLTPHTYRRFFRQKIRSAGVTSIDILSCLSCWVEDAPRREANPGRSKDDWPAWNGIGGPSKLVAGLGLRAWGQKPQAGRAQQQWLHCLVAGVERTWWRLCHLSLELRLIQTGVRFEKWADVVLFLVGVLEVPPRCVRPKKIAKEQIFVAPR